jgi:hypothetical protein
MLTNLNRKSNPKNKSTKIYIRVYTPYRYSINSRFLFRFGLRPSTSDFFMYIEKKTSDFERSNTSFLFRYDFMFGTSEF